MSEGGFRRIIAMSPHPPLDLDAPVPAPHTPTNKPIVINTKTKHSPSKNPLLKLSKKSPRGFVKSLAGKASTADSNGKQPLDGGGSPRINGKSGSDKPKRSRSARVSRSRSRGGRHAIFSGCTGGQRSRSCTPERNATLSCTLPAHIPPDLLNLPVKSTPPQPDVTYATTHKDLLVRSLDMNIGESQRLRASNPTPFDKHIQQLLQLQTMGYPLNDVTNMGTTKPKPVKASHGHTKDNAILYQESIYSKATAIPDGQPEPKCDFKESVENSEKDKGHSIFSFRRFSFGRRSAGSKGKKNKTEYTEGKKDNPETVAASTTKLKNHYSDVNQRLSCYGASAKDDHRKRSQSEDRSSRRVEKTPDESDYYNNGTRTDTSHGSTNPIATVKRTKSLYGSGRGMKGRPLPPLPTETNEQPHKGTLHRDKLSEEPYRCYTEDPYRCSTIAKPPPQGSVTLVRTIHLDKWVKNKWISGIAVTKKNEFIIVDLKGAYVIDEMGNLKRTIGSKGHNHLNEPIDVTVMCNGNIAFSDHADQDVKVFNCKGQFLRQVKDQTLTNIAGVTSNNRGEIIIAGTDKMHLSVHSEDDELLYTLPKVKDNRCTFEHPYTVAVNPLTQDIIVGDDYKQLVTALSSDGCRMVWRFVPQGGRDRHFFPSSICVDTDGYVFIADLYNEKVYMLDSSGKLLKTLSRGDGLRGGPGAIACDGHGHLLVADEERTIKVFKYGENGFALYRRTSYGPSGPHLH